MHNKEKGLNKMKTMKLKDIKRLVEYGSAKDITNKNEHIKGLSIIGVSVGVYGRNGLLLEDDNGKLYAITKRSTSIFIY